MPFVTALALAGTCLPGLAAVAQQAAPPPASTQALLSQADAVLRQMSQITGLPIKGELKKQVISQAEVKKYLEENLHEEMTPSDIHAQEALVRALGLVPQDFSLEKFFVSFYTEQAAGFYDFKRKTMFIAEWLPPDMQGMTLAHELTHALQDQNWDLDAYMHGRRGDDDATNARQAVVEGYATAAMLQQSLGGLKMEELPSLVPMMDVLNQQFDSYPEFSKAPYFFKIQALFPYLEGMGFIQAGLQAGGWKNLNAEVQHPPENTREIYEPQSYFRHQEFPKLTLAHPPALDGVPGLKFLIENTLGELGYNGLVGQLLSQDEAKSIGPGWLADRYLLYEYRGGNNYVLVARTRWMSVEAAKAFFHDYHKILIRKNPDLTTDKRSTEDEIIASAQNGATLLLRKNDECVWAEGVPAAQADAMLAWLRNL